MSTQLIKRFEYRQTAETAILGMQRGYRNCPDTPHSIGCFL